MRRNGVDLQEFLEVFDGKLIIVGRHRHVVGGVRKKFLLMFGAFKSSITSLSGLVW